MKSIFILVATVAVAIQSVASARNLPVVAPKANITVADWKQIRSEYDRHRRGVFQSIQHPGTYEARSRSQQWLTRFDGRSFEIQPNGNDAWRWGLQLQSYGFANQQISVVRPRLTAAGERFAYQWDNTVEEWFLNRADGLEHGFTLRQRPAAPNGPLTLHLAIKGTVPDAQLSADGRDITFADAQGTARIRYNGLTVTDARGQKLAARFRKQTAGLVLEVEERDAVYPITIDPIAQQAYLKASNTGASDFFGNSVAVSGDTVVVAAEREDSSSTGVNSSPNDSAADAGAVYVFTRSGSTWTQQAYLKASNTGANDRFGSSVAIDGDTMVVGAYQEDSSSTGVNGSSNESAANSGAAYVFTRVGGVWSQQAYLKPSNTGGGDNFGTSVAIHGDTIVVGAPQEDSSTTGINGSSNEGAANSGAAYVFTRVGGGWSQQAFLKASNTGADDNFGASVSVHANTVVVGAFGESSSTTGVNPGSNENAVSSGAAYVFVRSGSTWSQQAFLKASNTGVFDYFGGAVAVNADSVVVGAAYEASSTTGVNSVPNDSAIDSGAAYVFIRSGTSWSQQAYLKAHNTGEYDYFGRAVAISADTVLIGAFGESSSSTGVNPVPNENAISSGASYVFSRSGSAWSQQAFLKASNTGASDVFGSAVALSGNTMVVGALGEASSTTGVNSNPNDNAITAGAAYIFDNPPATVSITVNSVPGGLLFSSSGTGCDPGSGYTTPKILAWTPGSSCTLTFSTPQSGASGVQYQFSQWENASTNGSRAITAPTVAATYTATFSTQYQLTVNAGAGGTVSPASGNFYNSGTVVNVAATPNNGFTFANWTGPVASTSSSATTVTMDAPKSITANFTGLQTVTVNVPAGVQFTLNGTTYTGSQAVNLVPGTYTLSTTTPQSIGAGTQAVFANWSDSGAISHSITVASSPLVITGNFTTQYQLTVNAGAGGSATPASGTFYNSGTVVNVAATANSGFAFSNWTGPVASANSASTTVTMDAPKSITANFSALQPVTINVPAGVQFSLNGNNYTGSQTVNLAPGTYTLSTTTPQVIAAGTQVVFANWSDSGAISHSITVASSPLTITGNFTTQYQLTVNAGAGGSATPVSGTFYNSGSVVNVAAAANSGFVFANWTGPVASASSAATTVTMDAPKSVTANFSALQPVTINVPVGVQFSLNGSTYTGSQTVNLAPGTYPLSTTSPQAIAAGTQAIFANWSDAGAISHPVTVASSPLVITGNFTMLYQLTVNAGAGGTATPASGTFHSSGTVVNVAATPNTGFLFSNWTGPVASANAASTTVTMNAPASITANFTVVPPAPDITAQFTITASAPVLNRATGRYSRTVTVVNNGTATAATAFVLDNLATGYAVFQPAGFTVAAAPAGSPYLELGPMTSGASQTFTIQLTRTGNATLSYISRVLGAGPR